MACLHIWTGVTKVSLAKYLFESRSAQVVECSTPGPQEATRVTSSSTTQNFQGLDFREPTNVRLSDLRGVHMNTRFVRERYP